jgi:DNA-binding NarL/FixJ family response regulator
MSAPWGHSGEVAGARTLRAVEPSTRITVAVFGDPQRNVDRLAMALNACQEIVVLPDSERSRADMVIALAGETSDELMAEMRRAVAEAVDPTRCMVLVTNQLHSRHLRQAFRCGVVSVLPVREASPAMIAHVAVTSYHGGAILPGAVTRWLVDAARTYEQDVLVPNGLQVGGLTPREVEILRLLAEGLDTPAIAEAMKYSERTIKKDIRAMLSRLNLRNRVEAVSYAFRVGAI